MNTESHPIISPKKLIEVALPLDAINAAAEREKSIRHGHPSTLHLWWARRPLAAARAVIFSQMVNDPEDVWRCQNPGQEANQQIKGHWTKARARLFKIIEDLVVWENTTNETVQERARQEIRQSWQEVCDLNKKHPQASELFDPKKLPGFHDPFAGGGAIPLEAQRLGMESFASDLNPVAVLINKAMIEIPPKFAGMPPINPESRKKYAMGTKPWHGAEGLAEDVRYYGKWMRDEAHKRIGHLYPCVKITAELVADRPDLKPYIGRTLTVIAWLWARTVKSPNPAFSHAEVPLAASFLLATKPGKEAFVEPVVIGDQYRFVVRTMKEIPEEAKIGTKSGGAGANFRCLLSGTPIDGKYIMGQGKEGKIGARLMAIVAEGDRGRVYLSPSEEHEAIASQCIPSWKPDVEFFQQALGFRVGNYGMTRWSDCFTQRQLTALSTFSELINTVRSEAGKQTNNEEYINAIALYLAFVQDRLMQQFSTLSVWSSNPAHELVVNMFSRQTLSMSWDFGEINPFSDAASWEKCLDFLVKNFQTFANQLGRIPGTAIQSDAKRQTLSLRKVISTDPPYYDNIGYADLSDYFYVWLRQSLRQAYPEVFPTLTTPKDDELVATPHRHGGKPEAEDFFVHGMSMAMQQIANLAHPCFPITVYYAFKQSDTTDLATGSTGWETFLTALNQTGFAITGTWPMRTERKGRMRDQGSNALASSVVLVCRLRPSTAGLVSRREFIRELNNTLPIALDAMTRESEGLHSPVAPVDLSQAIIGPGMAVFSKYASVIEANGTPMTVRTALQLINRFLAEDDFDADTQFCLHWFEQYGWESGKFGEADTLSRAKGTSVDGVKQAGVLHAAGGKVRLLKWAEYPSDWAPQLDQRLPIWEVLHQLIRVFNTEGETGAAAVFAAVQSKAEAARQLAYRLYTLCERKNWAEDARAYNEVVTSWSGIEAAASKEPLLIQRELFDN
jgi:putative DNA methylase